VLQYNEPRDSIHFQCSRITDIYTKGEDYYHEVLLNLLNWYVGIGVKAVYTQTPYKISILRSGYIISY